jgi:hypothetical protein
MIDFECFERASCPRDEKAEAASLIRLWVTLSEKARREGLLSLEEVRAELGETWPGSLLGLVIDGFGRGDIRAIGEVGIAASGLSGRELLEAMIDLEACRSLQAGDRPLAMYMKLRPYLGADADLLTDEDLLAKASVPAADSAPKARDRKLDYTSIAADIAAKLKLSDGQVKALGESALSGNAFEGMRPDVLAIALLYLDEETRRSVLASLPCERQAAAIRSICDLEDFDADFYIKAARASLERLIAGMEKDYKPAGGVRAAVPLLRSLNRRDADAIIKALETESPALSAAIKAKMFVFEDLTLLDDRSVQKIIKGADSQRLAAALKGASPAVAEKFFSNMSGNAANMLKEDMEYSGPMRIGDVKEAREGILAIARDLEARGEIIVSAERPDEGVIQ